jgi:CheY-like chemotaxis protein
MLHPKDGNWSEHDARRRGRFERPRLLVVEDDTEMRNLVTTTLEGDGYRVVEARSGDEAAGFLEAVSLRDWSQRAVELVITDVRMANGDGFRLGEMIRASRWPISVIFMTAFPGPDVRNQADRLSATVLEKPFTLGTLRRIVLLQLAARAHERASGSDPRNA